MTSPSALPPTEPSHACALCGGVAHEPVFQKNDWTFARCRDCGLVALDPLPTAAQLAAHHEASYVDGGYAAFADAELVRNAIARHRFRKVVSYAGAGPWLDVGCSTGAFVAAAAENGRDVEGIELSTEAVRRAQARGLRVQRATAEDFRPTRQYGLVTAFDVLEHLPNPRAFLELVRGWLAPGGGVAMTLPNGESLTARALGRHWFYYVAPDHLHYFTPATVSRLLGDANFVQVSVQSITKPMPWDYARQQLEHFASPFAPLARLAERLVPRSIRERSMPLPLGEMLVTARPRGA